MPASSPSGRKTNLHSILLFNFPDMLFEIIFNPVEKRFACGNHPAGKNNFFRLSAMQCIYTKHCQHLGSLISYLFGKLIAFGQMVIYILAGYLTVFFSTALRLDFSPASIASVALFAVFDADA